MSSMLNVRVSEDTAEAIEQEVDRLGFDSRSQYLRHIINRRGELDNGASARAYDLEAALEEATAALADAEQVVVDIERLVAGNGSEPAQEAAVEPVASVDELDLPGQGDTLAARRDALQAVYDRLQELGEAQKGELLSVVDPDAVGYGSADSFWSNVIAGEDTLSRLPGVVSPGSGHGATWRYEGDGDE